MLILSRTNRIFMSFTFSDSKKDRDALHKHVFMRLHDLCMQNGCRFQIIDLCWKVREEGALINRP